MYKFYLKENCSFIKANTWHQTIEITDILLFTEDCVRIQYSKKHYFGVTYGTLFLNINQIDCMEIPDELINKNG